MTPAKTVWLFTAIAATAPVAACNMVSGADEIGIRADDDDGGDTNTGATGSTATAGVGGAATGGAATTVAATGAGGAGSSTNTGAGAGPTVCEYPAGPYGVDSGQILPPTLSWSGFAPGSSAASTFTAEDLFDCDGSRGIHAVVVDTSQYG
jgi:hypothetical protein